MHINYNNIRLGLIQWGYTPPEQGSLSVNSAGVPLLFLFIQVCIHSPPPPPPPHSSSSLSSFPVSSFPVSSPPPPLFGVSLFVCFVAVPMHYVLLDTTRTTTIQISQLREKEREKEKEKTKDSFSPFTRCLFPSSSSCSRNGKVLFELAL